MAYERINWQNEPSEATALNDVNLNKMDSAIYELDGKATTTETAITNLQNGKVDKVTGKGLSQVDNVTVTQHVAYGTVVSTIKTYGQDGTEVTSQVCNGIVVDSALSDSSTNPVQNKKVKEALDGKVDKVTGKGLSLVDILTVGQYTTNGSKIAEISYTGNNGYNYSTSVYNGVVVDSVLSDSSTNPVENKAIYDALNNLLPSKTVSGNPISISDASGLNAKALTVSMNPIQDLNGYNNPWVGGAGKNKLPFDISAIKALNTAGTWSGDAYTNNGVTYSLGSDGIISTSGTASGISVLRLPFTYSEIEMILNGCPSGGGVTVGYSVIAANSTGSSLGTDTGSGATISASNVANITQIQVIVRNGTSADNLQFKPMIRLSTETDPTFAPYSNICPISGRTEVSVTRTAGEDVETKTHQYSDTIYGGVDDFVNGELSNEWVVAEYDGDVSEAWAKASSSLYDIFYMELAEEATGLVDDIRSNSTNISIYSFAQMAENAPCISIRTNLTPNRLHIAIPNVTTVEECKAYLAEHNLQVCYKKATPTTIQTSAEEIELLKGQNVLSTDADDIELKYSVSLDSLLPTTTRTLAKSPIVEEPKEETDETEEQR